MLILVQNLVNKKTKFNQVRADIDDQDKFLLNQFFRQTLESNRVLMQDTYLTLMMLAFKRHDLIQMKDDVIPHMEDVVDLIKDNIGGNGSRGMGSFDKDFYLVVLRNFHLYSKQTKQHFFHHMGIFLDTHVDNFMSVFSTHYPNKEQEKETRNFFYVLVETSLITESPVLKKMAIECIVRVCTYQLTCTR